jgi:site-specific DNA recombinase
MTLRAPDDGSNLRSMIGALIYVRVSTKEQTENLSLPTQLKACEEYCRRQGYDILERFHEEGESAKSTDRSQLQNLLTYCRLNKGRVHFVVVFNLTRFARGSLPDGMAPLLQRKCRFANEHPDPDFR